jgi:DNA invertase Pin-like site-specific DNA recombinase
MKIVTYKRLSKEDRKRTQHGFDSQAKDMEIFMEGGDYEVVGEFQEFISGAADNKPELKKAMEMCEAEGAVLLVAKLDRLSRRVSQVALYMEGSVAFKVACLPNADNFQLHLFAALSEQERMFIKERTKRGLAAAQAKGIKIGRANEKYTVSPKVKAHEKRVSEAAKAKSVEQAKKLELILGLAESRMTLAEISRKMCKLNVEKVNGSFAWTSSDIKRMIKMHNLDKTNIKGVVWG